MRHCVKEIESLLIYFIHKCTCVCVGKQLDRVVEDLYNHNHNIVIQKPDVYLCTIANHRLQNITKSNKIGMEW